MDKRFFSFAVLIFLLMAPAAGAHPPLDIALEYDHQDQVLRVNMQHIVHDMKDHYIRKTVITKNNGAPVEKSSRRQTTPTSFVLDVPLPAKTGEQITVEAFCSEGGSLAAVLVVPAPGTEDKQKPATAPAATGNRMNVPTSGY